MSQPSDFYDEIVSRYESELGIPNRSDDYLNHRIFDVTEKSGACIINLCEDIASEAYYKHLETMPTPPRPDFNFIEGEESEPETWEEV